MSAWKAVATAKVVQRFDPSTLRSGGCTPLTPAFVLEGWQNGIALVSKARVARERMGVQVPHLPLRRGFAPLDTPGVVTESGIVPALKTVGALEMAHGRSNRSNSAWTLIRTPPNVEIEKQ